MATRDSNGKKMYALFETEHEARALEAALIAAPLENASWCVSLQEATPANGRWVGLMVSPRRRPTMPKRVERVLLIGQAPSRRGRPDRPLIGGRSGAFLMELTGCGLQQYVRRFERRNLLAEFPGSAPHGDLFPRLEAREAAERLLPELAGRRVVLVGRAVAEAFSQGTGEFYQWVRDERGFEFAVIPHPSPVNRHWNEPGARAAAMGFFARLANEGDQFHDER